MAQQETIHKETLPDLHINQEMLELEIEDHKIIHLRCGEWNWSGWCWSLSGNRCDGEFMTFMTRVLSTNKEYQDEFLKSLNENGVTYRQVAQQCIKDIESYDDALYSITGDNARWHFGDSYSYDHGDELESYNLTEKETEIVLDNAWLETPTITYEGFMAFEFGSDIKKMVIDAFNESENFDELLSKFSEDIGICYDIEEKYMSYCDDAFRIGISNTVALLQSGKYNK